MANDFSNNKWMIGDISPLSSLSTFGLILQGPAAFSGRNFESNLFLDPP